MTTNGLFVAARFDDLVHRWRIDGTEAEPVPVEPSIIEFRGQADPIVRRGRWRIAALETIEAIRLRAESRRGTEICSQHRARTDPGDRQAGGYRRTRVAISTAVCAPSSPTLCPPAGSDRAEGLLDVLGGQHAEDHRDARLELHVLQSACIRPRRSRSATCRRGSRSRGR